MNAEYDRRKVVVKYCEETVLSASQNNEDVLLYRALHGKKNGFYIDIGAGDANWDSVTNWFYRIGWRGINIEPNPNAFESLRQWRRDEINLNVGVSDTPGVLIFRQVLADERGWGWGLSSFVRSAEKAAREGGFNVKKMPVSVTTLTHIVETYCAGRPIDFLKIDVEGFEAQIIRSTNWRTIRPTVLCIEAIDLHGHPVFQSWEPHLLQHGYTFAIFDGTNNYYVVEERCDVLTQLNAGVNSHDRYRKIGAEEFIL